MRQFLRTKAAVQVAQLALFLVRNRPPVGPVSKFQHCIDMARLRVGKTLPECGGAGKDGLPEWLKHRRVICKASALHSPLPLTFVGARKLKNSGLPAAVYSSFMFISAGILARIMYRRNAGAEEPTAAPATSTP